MPFLIEPEEVARAIADGLEAGKPEISYPLRMALVMKLLGCAAGSGLAPVHGPAVQRLRDA